MNSPQHPNSAPPTSTSASSVPPESGTTSLSREKPTPGMVNLTHIIYALHGVSVLAGVVGAATVVGMMVTSWPSLLAVVLNYLSRSEVRGTWLESHFRWQIRTFWFALLWAVVAIALIFTIIGMVVGFPLIFVVGVWVIYRVLRGWIKLASREPMPMPVE